MIPREKNSRGLNNVTNLDEVRQARALAQSENSTDVCDEAPVDVPVKADGTHGNRRFDAEKVARIKAAIAAGEYEINPSRIADKFIEHDRNQ